jgi:hypothetical protein
LPFARVVTSHGMASSSDARVLGRRESSARRRKLRSSIYNFILARARLALRLRKRLTAATI